MKLMKPKSLAMVGMSLLSLVGCDDAPPPPTPGLGPYPQSKPATSPRPVTGSAAAPNPAPLAAPSAGPTIATRAFLDDKKEVAPGQAWSREVTSQSGGAIAFRVESQGPFSVSPGSLPRVDVTITAWTRAAIAHEVASFARAAAEGIAKAPDPATPFTVVVVTRGKVEVFDNRPPA